MTRTDASPGLLELLGKSQSRGLGGPGVRLGPAHEDHDGPRENKNCDCCPPKEHLPTFIRSSHLTFLRSRTRWDEAKGGWGQDRGLGTAHGIAISVTRTFKLS
jgi:hypothetical protein